MRKSESMHFLPIILAARHRPQAISQKVGVA